MKTGIYVRVSTEEQANEGYSIKAQEEKLLAFAKIKEWSVYRVYNDKGKSGKNITERDALKDMIKDIQKGQINNVLIYKIDRLTRNTKDLVSLMELFNTYDCAFNSLSESIDTHTASGRMFVKIIGIFAEFERENIIERSKLGFERKVREGYSLCTRTASYGYCREIGNKIQQINKEEAEIVIKIFDMFLNKNMSFLEIARFLNKYNIPTKENSVWHSRTVKNVLTNCNYVGKVRYCTKDKKRNFEVEGVHEAIISQEVFDETQELISKICTKSYTKRPKEENYYSGFLYCAKCGGRLVTHGYFQKRKGKNDVWVGGYRCRNRLKKKCTATDITVKNIEKAFVEYINKFEDFNVIDEVEIAKQENKKKKDFENLQKKYIKLEKKESEILNLYVNNKLNFDEYISIKKTVEKEKECIDIQLEEIEREKENENIAIKKEDILKKLKENWAFLSKLEKRQFLLKFVNKITIINEKPENAKRGIPKVINIEFNKF